MHEAADWTETHQEARKLIGTCAEIDGGFGLGPSGAAEAAADIFITCFP